MSVSDPWMSTWDPVQVQPLKCFHLANHAEEQGCDKLMLKTTLFSLYKLLFLLGTEKLPKCSRFTGRVDF